jgi:hypothetical protein
MTEQIKTLLEDVAAGRVDPAEAARRLDELRTEDRGQRAEGAVGPPAIPDVTRLVIRGLSRSVHLIGDPTVTTVSVDGPHEVRRDGSTMVISGEVERLFPGDEAFSLLSSGRWRELIPRTQSMTVRARPDLPVEVEVTAGSLTSENMHALERVRVTAGSAKIKDATEPIDVLVQAGSVDLTLLATHGSSRVRCESGSIKLRLAKGSDVRLTTDVQLAKLTVHPPTVTRGDEVHVGSGTSTLSLEVVMGSALVDVIE